MKEKVIHILEAVVIIVVGILIAAIGPSAIDKYFGILAIVIGSLLFILWIAILAQNKSLDVAATFLFPILITFGVALLAGWLSIAALIIFLIYLLIGFGIGLMIYGIFYVAKGDAFFGISQLVVGGLMVLFSVLYLTVPEFNTAFWIIVGVLVALYGALYLVKTLLTKDSKKQK